MNVLSSSSRDRLFGTRTVAKTATAALLTLAVGASLPQAAADPQQDQQQGNEQKDDKKVEQKRAEEIDRLLDAPIPKDVDGLLAHVDKISGFASETSDEVEQLKIDIDQAQGNLDKANKSAEDAQKKVDKLNIDVEASRKNVSGVSKLSLIHI